MVNQNHTNLLITVQKKVQNIFLIYIKNMPRSPLRFRIQFFQESDR